MTDGSMIRVSRTGWGWTDPEPKRLFTAKAPPRMARFRIAVIASGVVFPPVPLES
jgi:hypothetical protein